MMVIQLSVLALLVIVVSTVFFTSCKQKKTNKAIVDSNVKHPEWCKGCCDI